MKIIEVKIVNIYIFLFIFTTDFTVISKILFLKRLFLIKLEECKIRIIDYRYPLKAKTENKESQWSTS